MPWPLSGLGIRRGWSQLLYKALGVDRGRQSKGYEAKAATMTGKFLVDFSICFGPDGNEFNVGIYIQAGCPFARLLTGLSFFPSLLVPLQSFLFIHCTRGITPKHGVTMSCPCLKPFLAPQC